MSAWAHTFLRQNQIALSEHWLRRFPLVKHDALWSQESKIIMSKPLSSLIVISLHTVSPYLTALTFIRRTSLRDIDSTQETCYECNQDKKCHFHLGLPSFSFSEPNKQEQCHFHSGEGKCLTSLEVRTWIANSVYCSGKLLTNSNRVVKLV